MIFTNLKNSRVSVYYKIDDDTIYLTNDPDYYRMETVLPKRYMNMLKITNKFNTDELTYTDYMFRDCNDLETTFLFDMSNINSAEGMFYNCSSIIHFPDYEIHTDNIKGMFYSCKNVEDLSNITFVNSLEECEALFAYCTRLKILPNMITHCLSNGSYMFCECSDLETINLDNKNNENEEEWLYLLQNGSHMFDGCHNLKNVKIGILPFLIDGSYMFCNCDHIDTFEFGEEEMGLYHVENIESMFENCSQLKEIKIDNSNETIKNCVDTFYRCKNLKKVESLSVPNAEVTYRMFQECKRLEEIPEMSIKSSVNASHMFDICESIRDITITEAEELLNAKAMFQCCFELRNLNMPALDKIEDISWMFFGCINLTSFPEFTSENITTIQSAFISCESMTNKMLPYINTHNVTNMNRAFVNCKKLSGEFPYVIDCSSITDPDTQMEFMFGHGSLINGGNSDVSFDSVNQDISSKLPKITKVKFSNVREDLKSKITGSLLGNPSIEIEFV